MRGTILDFNPLEDRIDLSGWGVTDFEDLNLTSHSTENSAGEMHTLLRFADGQIRLEQFDADIMSTLNADHFILA